MQLSDDPNRWRRRRKTIPAVLGSATITVGLAPLIVPVLVVLDLGRGRRRMPMTRTGLFMMRYLFNEVIEIALAPALWVFRRVGGSDAGYRKVQRWSIRSLVGAADRWLGIRIDVRSAPPVEAVSGPLIVLCRHASLLDSSVPSLVFGLDSTWRIRSIVTDEALNDPGFDLIYQPLGTVFIDRDEGASARRVIEGLRRHDDVNDVATIYPEGRIFTPAGLVRSLERLGELDRERQVRLAGLRHLLPPRPGGVLALLDALPNADVVVIGHVGLEQVPSIRIMPNAVPLDRAVTVSIKRIARSEVPETTDERVVWLDRLWLDLDDAIEQGTPTRSAVARNTSNR